MKKAHIILCGVAVIVGEFVAYKLGHPSAVWFHELIGGLFK